MYGLLLAWLAGCGLVGVAIHNAAAGSPSTGAEVAITATIPASETVGDCTCTCDGFSVGISISEEPSP